MVKWMVYMFGDWKEFDSLKEADDFEAAVMDWYFGDYDLLIDYRE